jgi:hypothetical protein
VLSRIIAHERCNPNNEQILADVVTTSFDDIDVDDVHDVRKMSLVQ